MRTLHDVNAQEWEHRLATPAGRYKLAHRYRIALRCLQEANPGQWLDIGAGNGFLAEQVKRQLPSVNVTGTDFVPDVLRVAEALDETVVHDLNAGPLPLQDNSQDYITCLEVLEHVLFPRDVLSEIARLLKPGRRALVSVPNLQYIEYVVQLARGKVPHPAADERHMSIFTLRHLKKVASRCGLHPRRSFGTDADPQILARVSKRVFAKTILLEVEKAA